MQNALKTLNLAGCHTGKFDMELNYLFHNHPRFLLIFVYLQENILPLPPTPSSSYQMSPLYLVLKVEVRGGPFDT